MSSRVIRGPSVIGYHRRKSTRNLDLNSEPPNDNCDQGESSSQMEAQAALNMLRMNSLPPTTIDVEIIDDDIVECSATAFAEAKNKSRRNARNVVDLDLGHYAIDEEQVTISANNRNKRRRASQNHIVMNCDLYINLEGSNSSMTEKTVHSQSQTKEPVFNCPICMASFVEETSTKCGHIFCKLCIKAAVTAQGKCPTCRKKVTMKELIRVYLPAMG